jgi:TolB protein
VVRRALVVLAAAGALAGPAAADLPPIVFSSPGPPDLLAPHRYEIRLDGSGRRELPLPDGVVSPDGRLVAHVAGTDDARTIEVSSVAGGAMSTIAIGGTRTGTPMIIWSPDSRRLALAVARGCYDVSGKGTFCGSYEVWQAAIRSRTAVRVALGRHPAWSGDSTRLAFVRYDARFGRDSVFVIPAGGGHERALAPGAQPVWAPHGTRIAYMGPRGLMLIDALDPSTKRLLEPVALNGPLVWSPNGRALAYVHVPPADTKPWHLETIGIRTGTVRVLATTLTGESYLGPIAWSPDSRLLAYANDTVTYRFPGTPGRFSDDSELFVVRARGGKPRRLTHELPWAVYDDLAFTRDGLQLEYTATQVQSDRELYAVQPDGTGLVQLTHNLFDDLQPAWSPDGTRIAFARTGANSGYPFPRIPGIYVLDTTTRAEHLLVAITRVQPGVWPSWSPDGSLIAYARGAKIAIARTDGTLVRVIDTHGDPRHPTWSPDGSQIAFADGAERELLVVHTDGTGLRAVATVASADTPAWSPDGTWIAFAGRPSDTATNGIWIVHPDGAGFRLVTAAASPFSLAWSPDSSQLVYENYVSGSATKLRLTAIDGSSDREVPLSVVAPSSPAWRR